MGRETFQCDANIDADADVDRFPSDFRKSSPVGEGGGTLTKADAVAGELHSV